MRRMISWWRARRLGAARRAAADWERRALDCLKRMRKDGRQLVAVKRQLDMVSDSIREDLDAAAEIQRQQEAVVESLKQENEVLSRVLVPSLTAAHRLLLERYDAETAIQVRLRVAASTDQRE